MKIYLKTGRIKFSKKKGFARLVEVYEKLRPKAKVLISPWNMLACKPTPLMQMMEL